ncbi:MAG TPA: DUF4962 domain-containing protein [Pyrinomonadaceae bacterium]|jgi:hypothetical protein
MLKQLFTIGFLFCLLNLSLADSITAVSARESKDEKIPAFEELLKRPVKLRSELAGKHPRLFFSAAELNGLREKAKGAQRELWQGVLKNVRAVRQNPPAPGDPMLDRSGVEQKPGDISQYAVAFAIAEASFVYAVEGDEKHLEAAKKWLFAACKYEPWGYSFRTPNVDLPPAHLLYAVAFAYDVLFDRLTVDERRFVKEKLIKQARLMYEYFKYKPKKRYAYSQNHTSIPMAGLAMAAYVLMDETDEAQDWARLARAIYDRVLTTFGTDGYFYEGFHYFTFSFRWTIRYLDVHRRATGEDLYPQMRERFLPLKYYVAHSILPDGKTVFDFADTGDGAENRVANHRTETLYGDWEILYRLASVYRDAEMQAVAERVGKTGNFPNRENFWALLNFDDSIKPAAMSSIPTSYHFTDNDTAFWRSDWSEKATAFAFRSAPPEGHHATKLISKIPDWRQSTGHAHPDANSFIIWAGGKYLTGDTGYTGKKMTDDHNTVLINNRGQEKDGRHEVFKEVAPERLDKIRIAEFQAAPEFFYARGEAAAAYYTDLNVQKFDRHFLYVAPDYFIVWDELETKNPSEFSFLLNADRDIKISSETTAEIVNEQTGLRVIRISPLPAKSAIAPQMLMARGRPGSIEQGTEEQRGVQLQTVTTEKREKIDFLHFLQPFAVNDKTSAPKISAVENGLKISWANGAEDFVSLKTGARFVERRRKNGESKRLVLQNGGNGKNGK